MCISRRSADLCAFLRPLTDADIYKGWMRAVPLRKSLLLHASLLTRLPFERVLIVARLMKGSQWTVNIAIFLPFCACARAPHAQNGDHKSNCIVAVADSSVGMGAVVVFSLCS